VDFEDGTSMNFKMLMSMNKPIWSDFDRASSLLCGNKVPTRCNRWYL